MATTRTTCRLCLVRCGMIVETDNGDVISVKGDKEHPLSQGFLCVKGKASIEMRNSPKRVIYPQKRVGERGSGGWERVSWDDALDDIAARLNALIREYGPRSIAVQALPPKEYFCYDVFLEAIGSPTFFKHDSHQCFTPQLIADTLTYGNLITYPGFRSLEGTDVVMVWGVNLAETNGSKHERIRDAQRQGAKTIVVDPRRTRAAREADLWLRIRPGSDGALALGLLHIMIDAGWYNRSFIDQWTIGFDQLAERVKAYPPERVAAITWIPEEDIIAAARMFGEAENAAFYTFIGATMAGNSIATLRLMGFIPAIKGRIDRKGNNRFFLSNNIRMPSYYAPGTQDEAAVERLRDQLSADKFPLLAGPDALTAPYPHPRQVVDAMITGQPYPVRALWTSCNPLVGLEDTTTVHQALTGLDLLVVMDMFESPTAHIADYILPMTTHLESDAITEYTAINMVSARQQAVKPRGEARDEGDVVLDVLRRMGYGDKAPAQTYREMLDYRLEPLGIDFDAFKAMGTHVRKNSDLKYATGKQRPDGQNGFNTPSGRIEFTSKTLEAHGYDPLPDFVEPPLSPYSEPAIAQEYPLILISGTRSIEYYSTLGIEIDTLRKRRPYPLLEMAPETAAQYGLEDGEWVYIEAPTGDAGIQRKIAIVDGMDPRVVNAEGLWYMPGEDYVEGVFQVGCNVLTPLRDDTDPIIGGSIARCILCRISKLSTKSKAA